MTADEQLFARVSADAALQALLQDRVYPNIAPPAAPYPFIRYQKVSRVAEPAAFDAVNGLVNARWQFDVYANTFTAAQAVQAALESCLNDWRPATGPVVMVALINVFDRYEGDDATRIYRTTQEYQVTFTA